MQGAAEAGANTPIQAAAREGGYLVGVALTRDESHVYRLGAEVLPSITQVLQDVGIVDYGFLAPEERDAAMAKGRLIHLQTELDDRGALDESLADMGYVDGWRAFRRDYEFTPAHREKMVYHPVFFYAGTPDAVNADTVVEIKTGVPQSWVKYQLAAQAMLCNVRRRVCVELPGNGRYRAYDFKAADLRRDFDVFLSALTVYRVRREDKNL
jgi:hypothetical protein